MQVFDLALAMCMQYLTVVKSRSMHLFASPCKFWVPGGSYRGQRSLRFFFFLFRLIASLIFPTKKFICVRQDSETIFTLLSFHPPTLDELKKAIAEKYQVGHNREY
jgi:hypothetical protein